MLVQRGDAQPRDAAPGPRVWCVDAGEGPRGTSRDPRAVGGLSPRSASSLTAQLSAFSSCLPADPVINVCVCILAKLIIIAESKTHRACKLGLLIRISVIGYSTPCKSNYLGLERRRRLGSLGRLLPTPKTLSQPFSPPILRRAWKV